MIPIVTEAIIDAVKYGPPAYALVKKLIADYEAGKTGAISIDDAHELARLAAETGEDIYASLGITPPPA